MTRLFSYHLVVVVDDEHQGVTTVVRGADLLASTPRQIFLARELGYRRQNYVHIPLVLNQEGEKLSKQTKSQGLVCEEMSQHLWKALRFLGQSIPKELWGDSSENILRWALLNWSEESIPRLAGMIVDERLKEG